MPVSGFCPFGCLELVVVTLFPVMAMPEVLLEEPSLAGVTMAIALIVVQVGVYAGTMRAATGRFVVEVTYGIMGICGFRRLGSG
jgi:hypothetical protein